MDMVSAWLSFVSRQLFLLTRRAGTEAVGLDSLRLLSPRDSSTRGTAMADVKPDISAEFMTLTLRVGVFTVVVRSI
jgi:hypothetical protein